MCSGNSCKDGKDCSKDGNDNNPVVFSAIENERKTPVLFSKESLLGKNEFNLDEIALEEELENSIDNNKKDRFRV